MRQSILLFLFFTFFSTCKKDPPIESLPIEIEPIATISYSNVPNAFWSFFKNFEEEALKRGHQIDLDAQNISLEIMEITEEGVAGTCTYGTHHPGHIVIDATFWNQANNNFREMILFHELGHCSLFRGHREDSNLDGTCVSIMRSGLEDCRDNYRPTTRDVYLDELFGEVK